MTQRDPDYWYNHCSELRCDDVFTTADGLVKLDRPKAGDGTRWYVVTWHQGFAAGPNYSACAPHWSHEDDTIEPGDLIDRAPDPAIR